MTINRIRELFPDPDEEAPYGDFVLVSGPFGSAAVTHDTARAIEEDLDAGREWIVFRDRVGSRFRVRSREIRMLVESTTAQRAHDRRLDRARRLEEKSDRRAWEDDC